MSIIHQPRFFFVSFWLCSRLMSLTLERDRLRDERDRLWQEAWAPLGVMLDSVGWNLFECKMLVGGFLVWNMWIIFPCIDIYIYMICIYVYIYIYWECHLPNWQTHIVQRGRLTTNQNGFIYLWKMTRWQLKFLCVTMKNWDIHCMNIA